MTKTADETTVDTLETPIPKKHEFSTVTLDNPVVHGEQKITSLTLRRPNSGSLRGLNLTDIVRMNVDALQRLLPRVSDPMITEADVAAMDPADLTACGVEVVGFLLSKTEREAYQ